MTEAMYWWAKRKLMGYYQQAQPWTGELVDAILETSPRRVLDFGCNAGRNLRAIQERDPSIELVGIDVNEEAIAWGRKRWGLDLRLGNEELIEPGFDVAFTCSVLDHIPDPTRAIEKLAAAAPRLVLLEPWLGHEGEVESHNPYTYSWDYGTRLRAHGFAVTSKRFPIGERSIAPMYRLYRARLRAPEVELEMPEG